MKKLNFQFIKLSSKLSKQCVYFVFPLLAFICTMVSCDYCIWVLSVILFSMYFSFAPCLFSHNVVPLAAVTRLSNSYKQ